VKPWTKANKCSLAEEFANKKGTKHLVGRCTAFVSHPWSVNFKVTLSAVVEYEKRLPAGKKEFYFVDYFCINQHLPENELKMLATLVKKCRTLLLMAHPWRKPVVLDRLWCIYEVANAAKTVIILPPEGTESFQETLINDMDNVWSFLSLLFENINCANATATMDEDVIEIKEFIKINFNGFGAVNLIVADGFRKWYQNSVLECVYGFPVKKKGTEEYAKLLYDAGEFCRSQHMLNEADRLYSQSGAVYKKLNSNNWLLCQLGRIHALKRIGRLRDATTLALKNVDDHIQAYGMHHESTLRARRVLASVYFLWGNLCEAEEILREVLERFEQIQLPMSIDIRQTMVKLGETLMAARKIKEANNILKGIRWNTKAFGRSRACTLVTVSLHARCIALGGNHNEAIKLFEEALPILRTNLGANHGDVQKCVKWLKESQAQVEEIKMND